MHAMFANKKGVVMGVANGRSIATFISKSLSQQGAELAFSHLPDERGRMKKRVEQAVGDLKPTLIAACDVNSDQDLDDFFAKIKARGIDFGAQYCCPLEDIRCPTIEVIARGLQLMESSVYSFIACAKELLRL